MQTFDEGIPGHYEFSMVAFRLDDVPEELRDPRLSIETRSYTYDRLRERLGGDEGVVVDPRGGEHRVSLKPWAGPDVAEIRFDLGFRFVPDAGYEDEYQRRLRTHLKQRTQS
jgi:hypothetical protein